MTEPATADAASAPAALPAALPAAALTPAVEPALLAWIPRSPFPDGAAEAPALTQAEWQGVYSRLVAAARAPGLLPAPYVVQGALAAYRPDGAVPIAVVDVPVAVAEADAARQAAARAFADGTPVDVASLVPGASRHRAFAAAALLHEQWGRDVAVYRGRTVTYSLDERFWLALPGEPRPDAITLDPGDGDGARDISLGGTVAAAYAESLGSVATLRLAARFGGETRTARFTLPIGGPPAAPIPDEIWPLSADPGDGGPPVTGRATAYRAPGHADVVNPVLLSEGFPGGYAADYMHDLLNQAGLLDALGAAGYDVVVLGYDAGAGPIQRNAPVVVAAIAEARGRTARPLVVGGVSMGGLVTRYALAWMETHGVDHGTRTFLTIDTPHGGAYTSPADQWLARLLAAMSPDAAALAGALGSPANQQFVMRVIGDDGSVAPSAARTAFLADLAALGSWPQRSRRLATSSGHGRGAMADPVRDRPLPMPGRLAVAVHGAPFVEARLHTAPAAGACATIADGRAAVVPNDVPSSITVAGDVPWDDVPGATNDYHAVAAGIVAAMDCAAVTCHVPLCCSVPTVSALAIDQDPRAPVPPPTSGASPFHDYVCSDDNERHCVITPAVARWIVDRLGAPGGV